MANNYFQFKQFKIIQEKAAMKVGTDGVLLGAWANCQNKKNVLDIGTGTGLIALMLAQQTLAKIDAIEIDCKAAEEATNNASASAWSSRITVFCESFQQYVARCTHKYDLIVSNPPFFINALKAPETSRNTARHTDTLNPEELFKGVALLLTPTGCFDIIIPAENLEIITKAATENSLFCNKILWIKPKPTVKPKRVLLSFSQNKTAVDESVLVIESGGRHNYSDDYKTLTRDFYLAF